MIPKSMRSDTPVWPGRTTPDRADMVDCEQEHCLTCGDVALRATVLSVCEEDRTASVQIGQALTEVDITLINGPAIGDIVLVHAGLAIARVDADDL